MKIGAPSIDTVDNHFSASVHCHSMLQLFPLGFLIFRYDMHATNVRNYTTRNKIKWSQELACDVWWSNYDVLPHKRWSQVDLL